LQSEEHVEFAIRYVGTSTTSPSMAEGSRKWLGRKAVIPDGIPKLQKTHTNLLLRRIYSAESRLRLFIILANNYKLLDGLTLTFNEGLQEHSPTTAISHSK
jgi:hypothetical protein